MKSKYPKPRFKIGDVVVVEEVITTDNGDLVCQAKVVSAMFDGTWRYTVRSEIFDGVTIKYLKEERLGEI